MKNTGSEYPGTLLQILSIEKKKCRNHRIDRVHEKCTNKKRDIKTKYFFQEVGSNIKIPPILQCFESIQRNLI